MDDNKNEKIIHTYMSDMAEVIREDEGSVIKATIKEKEDRELEEILKKSKGTRTQKFLLFFSSLIIIFISILGFFYLYNKKIEKNNPVIKSETSETFISFEEQTTIDISTLSDKKLLGEEILKEEESTNNEGFIKNIFIKKSDGEYLETKEFLTLLSENISLSFIELLGDNFQIGSMKEDENKKLFIILETTDFDKTYAKMLLWEKTIVNDLGLIFKIKNYQDTEIFLDKFSDEIIKNKYVRVLSNDNGDKLLMYSFIDNEKLLITNSEELLKKIIEKNIANNS